MALIVAALYVGDHPQLLPRFRNQTVSLDTAYLDEGALRRRLEGMLGVEVRHLNVRTVDLVRDTTVVDGRYRLSAGSNEGISAVGPSRSAS
jgi:hypothetical protein